MVKKKKQKKKMSKREWKGLMITVFVMFVLGVLRTVLPNYLSQNLLWVADMIQTAISFLFIPLVYFIVTNIFNAKTILKR